jgi:multiple sugar transport system permease protein
MKVLVSRIREFFGKIIWVVRRKYNQFKSVVVFGISYAYTKVSRKGYRRAKKRIKRDYIKDYVGLNDYNLDIRFDLDSDKIIDDIRAQYKALKENKKESLSKEEKNVVDAEKERIYKLFQERLQLALTLEEELIQLEYERQRRIRQISVERSVYDEEVEKVHDEISAHMEELKIEYNQASKKLAETYKPTKGKTEASKLAIRNLQITRTYQSLPETRKAREKKDKIRRETKGILQALLYLTPVIILLVIFTFYPIFNSFRLVVYEGYNETTNVGHGFTLFGNFKKVLTDANFIVPGEYVKSSAMINTVLIVLVTVPMSIIISLLIAVLLNSIKPFSTALQTIFFLPYVTNSIAVGLVFAYMFQNTGLFNQFLSFFNIDGGRWIQHGAPYWKAMFVLMLFSIWNGLAFKIMVFLSSIQGIDKQYYQAASIDATPRFKQFRRITAPLISPTILYIVITSVIGAFKTYNSVIAIFGNSGRPPGADYHLKTIVFYIYDYFNFTGKLPEAAAASIVLFLIILLFTGLQMQVSKKRVHY